jgi:hypothetical protein
MTSCDPCGAGFISDEGASGCFACNFGAGGGHAGASMQARASSALAGPSTCFRPDVDDSGLMQMWLRSHGSRIRRSQLRAPGLGACCCSSAPVFSLHHLLLAPLLSYLPSQSCHPYSTAPPSPPLPSRRDIHRRARPARLHPVPPGAVRRPTAAHGLQALPSGQLPGLDRGRCDPVAGLAGGQPVRKDIGLHAVRGEWGGGWTAWGR